MSFGLGIIVVCKNNKVGLRKTLESLMNWRGFIDEIIIVDGNSTDGSSLVHREFDSLVSKCVSEPDDGIYDAMNKGICLIDSKYVAFINSGDRLLDLSFIGDCPEADVIIADVKLPNHKLFAPNVPLMYLKNTFHHQGVIYKKSILKGLGLFNTKYRILADYDLNLRIVRRKYSVTKVDFVMSEVEGGGVSSEGRFSAYLEEIEIRNDCLPSFISLPLSTFSILRYIYKAISFS